MDAFLCVLFTTATRRRTCGTRSNDWHSRAYQTDGKGVWCSICCDLLDRRIKPGGGLYMEHRDPGRENRDISDGSDPPRATIYGWTG